jgi:hypothetical protein
LSKTVRSHAQRHREALLSRREQTDLTAAQAAQIIGRIDRVLTQLPAAIEQVRERLIAGRQVANADKVLSLYEDHVHVIVRGKMAAEVEFGNTLLLCEQRHGLIVDWQLSQDQAPADSQLVPQTLERLQQTFGKGAVHALGADRGFDSQNNQKLLDTEHIGNGICPRDPDRLAECLRQDAFRRLQTRRAQTEGRIAIVKNVFLGRPLRAKGFENRHRFVAWAILTHNVWLLARLTRAAAEEVPAKRRRAVA